MGDRDVSDTVVSHLQAAAAAGAGSSALMTCVCASAAQLCAMACGDQTHLGVPWVELAAPPGQG